MPTGADIGDNGAIDLDTNSIVTDFQISLVPTATSGSIQWSCSSLGLTQSQLPSSCVAANSSDSSNDSNDDADTPPVPPQETSSF